MVARTLSVFLRFALNVLTTRRHPSLFQLPILITSNLIPKQFPVHLAATAGQPSPATETLWLGAPGRLLPPGELWPGRVLPLLGCPPGCQTMPGAGGVFKR